MSEAQSGGVGDAGRLRVRTRDGSSQTQYSRHDYLAALQQAWHLVSMDVETLSEQGYSQLLATGDLEGPSAVRVIQVFGTWRAALEAAGVPALAPSRTYRSAWTDQEILEAVAAYLSDRSTAGTYGGWDQWRRQERPAAPSAQTLRNRFGSWSEAKSRALKVLSA